jgi:ubiquinone biosynthesis protein UbiJ
MARRNSFDFAHTCPKIDKAIGACKERVEYALIPIIQSICEHIPDDKATELAKKFTNEVYLEVENCFESVRETNEEMRDSANKQIADLEDEIETLKYEVKHLERQLDAVS